MTGARFGTDGLRGVAGQPPIDAETMRRAGAALGVWLETQGHAEKRVVIGHDGRASAAWILASLTEGLAATEAIAIDVGLCTTPALAFLARTEPCAAGIMISASHNPPEDNGIKIFGHDGTKLADAAERELERLLASCEPDGTARGRSKPKHELLDRYVDRLASEFASLDLSGTRIALDAANGGGSELARVVLGGFGAELVTIGCAPDGTNINAGVGAVHPEALAAAVRAHGAALGIALDGDGDRGVFVDEHGTVHDGDAVLATLGLAMHARGALPHATVVATVMSNLGLTRLLREHGIALHTTPVGDRHVVQAMKQHGYALGGEQSGHIVLAGNGRYTGDGLFTALTLLALPERRQGFARLLTRFVKFPQLLLNVPVSHKPDLATLEPVQRVVRAIEEELGQDGRVVLRYSGTQKLCRVMVEGPDDAIVRRAAEAIAAAVREALPQ